LNRLKFAAILPPFCRHFAAILPPTFGHFLYKSMTYNRQKARDWKNSVKLSQKQTTKC